jgi:hypothetical protein
VDQLVVTEGFGALRRFAEANGLGAPRKVLRADPGQASDGICCKWDARTRHAIGISHEYSREADEIERLVRDWINSAGNVLQPVQVSPCRS